MAYYRSCPECGAALDPNERCDCAMEAETQSGKTRSEAQETRTGSFYISRAGIQSQSPTRIIYAR